MKTIIRTLGMTMLVVSFLLPTSCATINNALDRFNRMMDARLKAGERRSEPARISRLRGVDWRHSRSWQAMDYRAYRSRWLRTAHCPDCNGRDYRALRRRMGPLLSWDQWLDGIAPPHRFFNRYNRFRPHGYIATGSTWRGDYRCVSYCDNYGCRPLKKLEAIACKERAYRKAGYGLTRLPMKYR